MYGVISMINGFLLILQEDILHNIQLQIMNHGFMNLYGYNHLK